jgi:hypothetical protein
MEILTTFRGMSVRLGSRLATAALAVLCLAPMPVAAVAAESLEYSVKAAYLSKFGIYVEWPDNAFSSTNSDIGICLVGEDPFGAKLDEAARGQRIGDRAIVVRRLQNMTRDSGCHILYIGGDDPQRTSQIIESLRDSTVLTVTDIGGIQEGVGVINFVVKDNRVRFDIDDAAAGRNGLTISSKLLGLALNVKQRH